MTPSGFRAARRLHANVTRRACHVTCAAAEAPALAVRATVRARRSCTAEKAAQVVPRSQANAGIAERCPGSQGCEASMSAYRRAKLSGEALTLNHMYLLPQWTLKRSHLEGAGVTRRKSPSRMAAKLAAVGAAMAPPGKFVGVLDAPPGDEPGVHGGDCAKQSGPGKRLLLALDKRVLAEVGHERGVQAFELTKRVLHKRKFTPDVAQDPSPRIDCLQG
eukprot:6213298-Pleurochrysis_carterae.AAC.9